MEESYLACVMPWPLTYAPDGWALCNGQTLPIQTNQALFSLIGTSFGGNGTTTFQLPNLTGRFIQGSPSTNVVGAVGGAKSVALNVTHLPQHNHTLGPVTATMPNTLLAASTAATGTPTMPVTGDKLAQPAATSTRPYATPASGATANTPLGGLAVTTTGAIENTGSAAPIPLLPPYQALTFIICISGLYPMRWN